MTGTNFVESSTQPSAKPLSSTKVQSCVIPQTPLKFVPKVIFSYPKEKKNTRSKFMVT